MFFIFYFSCYCCQKQEMSTAAIFFFLHIKTKWGLLVEDITTIIHAKFNSSWLSTLIDDHQNNICKQQQWTQSDGNSSHALLVRLAKIPKALLLILNSLYFRKCIYYWYHLFTRYQLFNYTKTNLPLFGRTEETWYM